MMKHVYGLLGRWKILALLLFLPLMKLGGSLSDPSVSSQMIVQENEENEPRQAPISVPESFDYSRLTFEGLDQQEDLDAVLFEVHRRKKTERTNGEVVPLRVGQYFVWKHRNDMKSTDPNNSRTPDSMRERIREAYADLTGGDYTDVYALPSENTTREVTDTIRNIRKSDNKDDKLILGIILCVVVLVGWKIARNWQQIADGCAGCFIPIIVIVVIMIFVGAMSFDDVKEFLRDLFGR